MKVYLVGGAVRDKLLGKNPQDYDYVVTGASADYFLKAGYQQVGMSFSVFLHPETKSEYSLIRGNTLEDDLVRRDLTINSMAIDENGKLIDPFGGKKDLDLKILRPI